VIDTGASVRETEEAVKALIARLTGR